MGSNTSRSKAKIIWVRLFSLKVFPRNLAEIITTKTVGRGFIPRRAGYRCAGAAGNQSPPYSESERHGQTVRRKSYTQIILWRYFQEMIHRQAFWLA